MSFSGRCLCGNISYEVAQDAPAVMGVCHCKNCQRQAGSAFSTIGGVARGDFRFVSGTPKRYVDSDTDSGNTVERYFCSDCGSPIYSVLPSQADMLYLKTGTMDDTSDFTPQFHVWCSTKQSWFAVDEAVPHMEKQG